MKNTNDMTGSINIIDDEYSLWVKQLGSRYRQSRISAACQVNGTLIEYYWNLGRDITSKDAENRYGSRFYSRLSADLRSELPGVEGLSETNIRYAKRFYQLYCGLTANLPQVVEDLRKIPWGHHRYIIDKCSGSPDKAMFYVMQAWHNGWSRAMLLNFIDLLFYNLNIRCYVVVEVKIEEFDSSDIGQLGTYVTAVNHILKKDGIDNPTIGLLICKSKDSLLAQYALESSSQPLGISEYELSRLYPAEVEGTMPSIKEIEAKLKKQ